MARRNNKAKYQRKAKEDAKKGNFQDAFADEERAKGSKAPGSNRRADATQFGSNASIDCHSSDNDSSWYIPNGQMLKDVASINFGIPSGKPLRTDYPSVSGVIGYPWYDPGIMVYHVVPTVGQCAQKTDPYNVAMQVLYQAVRNKTSGTSYYEAPDLMMAVTAMASAYAYYAWMVRLYGVMATPDSVLNRYRPQAMVQAMHADYEALLPEIANFRTYINQFAYRLSSFAVPLDIDIFKRWIFMNENIYTDASGSRAQYYIYNMEAYWTWTVEDVEGQTNPEFSMTLTPLLQSMDLPSIISIGNKLLNPLFGSDDIRYMTADILKAFGEGGLFKAVPIAETYSVTPIYNAEVLSQMENATILPAYSSLPSGTSTTLQWKVKSGTGLNNAYLVATYQYPVTIDSSLSQAQESTMLNALYGNGELILNFHKPENPTPEEVMVATRLCVAKPSFTISIPNVPLACVLSNDGTVIGSEVVLGATILTMGRTGNIDELPIQKVPVIDGATTATVISYFNRFGMLSSFDWHPQIQPAILTSTTGGYYTTPLMDLDNYAYVSVENLVNMNYTAAMGLFVKKV